jgi:hypothetical protein
MSFCCFALKALKSLLLGLLMSEGKPSLPKKPLEILVILQSLELGNELNCISSNK